MGCCECCVSAKEAVSARYAKLMASLCSTLSMSCTALEYYASTQVIFYSEIALIMLCSLDLVVNATLLCLLVFGRDNDAQSYTAWAISDDSITHLLHWNEVFIVVLAFFLLESLVRLYYCLKLAYHHNQKVTDGELCCMKCHFALMSAAMTSEIVMPHVVSAISLILFFIYASAVTGSQTMQFHADYFAQNPFRLANDSAAAAYLDGEAENHGEIMRETMYYKLGRRVLKEVQPCLHDKNVSLDTSTQQLLNTGRFFDLVEDGCARKELHCLFSSRYVQLSTESVQAIIIYLVIRCLFGHVINMHEYEVYNQQTRLLVGSAFRLIRVYKVWHQRRNYRHSRISGVMQLPRQALMSIVHLGANAAARFRNPKEARTLELHATPKDLPMPGKLECSIGERMVAAITDPEFDDSSWAYDLDGEGRGAQASRRAAGGCRRLKDERRNLRQDWQADSDDDEEAEDSETTVHDLGVQRFLSLSDQQSGRTPLRDHGGAPLQGRETAVPQQASTDLQNQSEPAPQDHQLYNRRDAAATGKKVNVEHLKIRDLFPSLLASAETAGPQQQKQQQQRLPDTHFRPEGDAATSRSKRTNNPKRESHIVFSDETYYSLDA